MEATETLNKPDGQRAPRGAKRFAARRDAIIASAVTEMNRHGVRGMTLGEVAASLGLVSTAVMYYFRSKEELAVAAMLASIAQYDALIADAARLPVEARVSALVRGYLAFRLAVRQGAASETADTSDIRALNSAEVNAAFLAMFRSLRRLVPETVGETREDRTGRAVYLWSELTWTPAWIFNWRDADFPRIGDRFGDVLAHGVAGPGAHWRPTPPEPLDDLEGTDLGQAQFLRAATALINDEGYHGASVERISAFLRVTKGAFYHHNENKDELVIACFQRTFDLMWRAIDAAEARGGTGLDILADVMQTLVRRQLTGAPLLRTSALSTAPEAMRPHLLGQFRRITIRLASLLCDGVRDGSIRPVDTAITAQALTAAINAASELNFWRPEADPERVAQGYVRTVLRGAYART